MDTTSYGEPGRKLSGLDVGTGASCIYPLLGTAQRAWCFVATGEPFPSELELVLTHSKTSMPKAWTTQDKTSN
jgi:23S rRNA A1618 N6-methylase RlmF